MRNIFYKYQSPLVKEPLMLTKDEFKEMLHDEVERYIDGMKDDHVLTLKHMDALKGNLVNPMVQCQSMEMEVEEFWKLEEEK